MLGVIRILLGPALMFQGNRVRRDILRLPEPAGARSGRKGEGSAISILVLGDSAAAGVGAPDQSIALSGQLVDWLAACHRVRWRLHAKTGWTITDGLDALADLPDEQFDVALVSLGVNDVTTETPLARWLTQYERIVERLRSGHGVKLIIACALPPMDRFPALPQPLRWYLGRKSRELDKALAKWASRTEGMCHLPFDTKLERDDFAEDGFHPGPGLYDGWATAAAAIILPWAATHLSPAEDPEQSPDIQC
ncbi:MAG: SGNH/GDSL hydrolase family protein [Pseudomonadota bacterium]